MVNSHLLNDLKSFHLKRKNVSHLTRGKPLKVSSSWWLQPTWLWTLTDGERMETNGDSSLAHVLHHPGLKGLPRRLVVKNLPTNAQDAGSLPGSGKSPGVGNDNPLQYSCLENLTDGGAWGAIVHGVVKSWTWVSKLSMRAGPTWKEIYSCPCPWL